ncbi:NlpC/P60 family protein [Marivivens aquimaris]|uniref:NlpC/P60 family protein n=1 Tax=Marivivens aquimaris TaxID=2774876 RepID=UPI00187FA7C5|nr:TIGR02594 family protein [Marivivens aquimaris]
MSNALDPTFDPIALQERLNELGFGPLVVDGVIGPRTEAAIVAFKKSIGFRARPYVGPLTLQALFDAPLGRTIQLKDGMPWMAEAARLRGLHEGRDLSSLRKWFSGRIADIDPREIPWCGAFVATAFKATTTEEPPKGALGARQWLTFGKPVKPQLGAVVVFWRGSRTGWQGHVGFYWGEDEEAFHILGGNQSDAVTVTRMSRARLLGARWPSQYAAPNKIIHLTADGQPLSTRES